MNAQRLGSSISGDSEVAGALRSRLPRLPMRSLFPTTLQNPELLTPSASDCAARRPLTKSEEEETIIINRPGRSTYPDEKSVLTSGATPLFGSGHSPHSIAHPSLRTSRHTRPPGAAATAAGELLTRTATRTTLALALA